MDRRHTNEIEQGYGNIQCPVTILWGEKDTWLPLERGYIAGRISTAHLLAV